MRQFAKIFQHEKYGQILVTNNEGDTGAPEVRVSYIPQDLGVCDTALKFNDSEEGGDLADKAFEKMDLNLATEMILQVERALGR